MQINNTVLEKLEKLSHLHVDEAKKDEIIDQLTEIVSYVENLSELDTSALDASFSTLEGGTPMQEDLPHNDPTVPQSILEHAPESKDDFFIVPAIIE
ncbi:MAG: Asp-tRNA(Asn)/Glu-tRNA(Gln) amidotransferase subunit GatC [Campylobacterota bacterium]|nr:Asp-tRNA(Asn)/Glu-tRNA(Gln) amidotransferase subunit GatC [Campylobacterota bacterium]